MVRNTWLGLESANPNPNPNPNPNQVHNTVNVPVAPMWRRKGQEAPSKETKAASGRSAASSPRAGTFGSGRVEWRLAFAQRVL